MKYEGSVEMEKIYEKVMREEIENKISKFGKKK
jgi:hypothetical protein